MDNRTELAALRRSIGATQEKMAALMGISTRGYEELEAGRSQVKKLHLYAARHAVLQHNHATGVVTGMPDDLRELVRGLAAQLDKLG